ncbi:hypothetical protein K493DRAFT_307228 [Basidiobolus meristosporus CBS 931.73]|uniref:G-protein coupled receptors family 3 profile domain-containing protein n=1 Tax=Basidiobolus meristosporus CBS 931.73 TaxID=1314790 RepID=A0A1Y1XII6_9FUNG|nr:hypothetical protein K493DRAFT_307228 [Basidiobolus meristosporus CBS 931.73]|eukprot:ORX85570.1 hypothetical protein K493DRAFT_307228 [Basidiobolus meristosporus CBS 931.73]
MDQNTQLELNDRVELLLITFTFPLVTQDVYYSIRMVLTDHALIYKINLVQSLLLFCTGLVNLAIRMVKHQASCVAYFYSYNIMAFISVTLLLTLVYLKSLCTNRHIRLIKGMFAFSQGIHLTVDVLMLIKTHDIFANSQGGCSWISEDLYVILLLSNNTIIVVVLASITIFYMYRYAKVRSSPIFKVLIRDGLIFLLLITLVTVVVLILQILRLIQSGILLHGSWIILSLLTTQQCRNSYRLRRGELQRSERFSKDVTVMQIDHPSTYYSRSIHRPNEMIAPAPPPVLRHSHQPTSSRSAALHPFGSLREWKETHHNST